MSWLFSQALVAEYSEGCSSDGEQFAPSNTTNTPAMFLSQGKTTEVSNLSRFGMTCELLTESLGAELLTWFLVGFRAKISALQTTMQQDLTEKEADCGPKCGELLGTYDPDLHLWRTHQHSLFGGLEEFSETWPRWGIMQNGAFSALPMLEHDTSENACGSWPTPTKWEEKYVWSKSPGDHYHGIGWILWNTHNLQPTPQVYEAMQGWPIGWTELQGLETVNAQEWYERHGTSCAKKMGRKKNNMVVCKTSHNNAILQGLKPHARNTGTSA
jgi:hypothetical protein